MSSREKSFQAKETASAEVLRVKCLWKEQRRPVWQNYSFYKTGNWGLGKWLWQIQVYELILAAATKWTNSPMQGSICHIYINYNTSVPEQQRILLQAVIQRPRILPYCVSASATHSFQARFRCQFSVYDRKRLWRITYRKSVIGKAIKCHTAIPFPLSHCVVIGHHLSQGDWEI